MVAWDVLFQHVLALLSRGESGVEQGTYVANARLIYIGHVATGTSATGFVLPLSQLALPSPVPREAVNASPRGYRPLRVVRMGQGYG